MMIVKYQINGEKPSIMHVVDVYKCYDTVFFTPLGEYTEPVKISPVSDDRYNWILSELYTNRHTDVTDLYNRTSYDEDEEKDGDQ